MNDYRHRRGKVVVVGVVVVVVGSLNTVKLLVPPRDKRRQFWGALLNTSQSYP